jgi:hypothetical protein
MLPTPTSEKALSRALLDVLIRAGLMVVLAIFCFGDPVGRPRELRGL